MTPADPGAIDLDEIKARPAFAYQAADLIAAVEALRVRVGELNDRAEAAETSERAIYEWIARVVFRPPFRRGPNSTSCNARESSEMTALRNETDLEFTDISSEAERVYTFPTGQTRRMESVLAVWAKLDEWRK